MNDRELILKLLELGVTTFLNNREAFADPSTDTELNQIGVAAVAVWLEELGRLRLVGKVEPRFRGGTGLLVYQVTEEAVKLWKDPTQLEQRIKPLIPAPSVTYDIFLSYATDDSHIANELREALEAKGLRCFLAEKDIAVATRWENQVRSALLSSKRILLLITPRSKNRPWVLLETGAAWALEKELIPALMHVAPNELIDPVRHYQARIIETPKQLNNLISELAAT